LPWCVRRRPDRRNGLAASASGVGAATCCGSRRRRLAAAASCSRRRWREFVTGRPSDERSDDEPSGARAPARASAPSRPVPSDDSTWQLSGQGCTDGTVQPCCIQFFLGVDGISSTVQPPRYFGPSDPQHSVTIRSMPARQSQTIYRGDEPSVLPRHGRAPPRRRRHRRRRSHSSWDRKHGKPAGRPVAPCHGMEGWNRRALM